MIEKRTSRQLECSYREMLVVALIASVLVAPIIVRMTGTAYDYVVHRDIAAHMQASHQLSTPHFLLQTTVLVLYAILPGTLDNALTVILILAYAASALVLYRIFRVGNRSKPFAGIATLALMLAAPIAALAPLDKHLYFGYIPSNVYHNPTIILLKPLALISFCYALRTASEHRVDARVLIVCAGFTVACAITKPSFTICILPALAVFTLIQRAHHRRPSWTLLIAGFFLPAIVTLGVQYWITYSSSQLQGVYQGRSSIIVAPLVVMKYWSSFLFAKLLLSLAFPLSVLALHFKKAIRDASLQLAWLLFLVGSGYTYLLAESGPRLLQGNFLWSGQIAIFVLFAYSLNFLINTDRSPQDTMTLATARRNICLAVLALHFVSGILFYGSELIQTERYW